MRLIIRLLIFIDYFSISRKQRIKYPLCSILLQQADHAGRCAFDSDNNDDSALRNSFVNRESFELWIQQYRLRLAHEKIDTLTQRQQVRRVNPKYILRNYLAQQAIDKSNQEQDSSDFDLLLTLVQSTYDEHRQHLSLPNPSVGKYWELSGYS